MLSALGLVVALTLWGLSYVHVHYFTGTTLFSLEYGAAMAYRDGFVHDVIHLNPGGSLTSYAFKVRGYSGLATSLLPGIRFAAGTTSIAVPMWIPSILFAALAWKLSDRRSARRQRLGQCLSCGYDLRGSSSVCPECGHRPSYPENSADIGPKA